jgi:SAM-dependent methyltransferase
VSDERERGRAETPVRALGAPDESGYLLLRDVGSTYSDGAEDAILELMRTGADLRSDSDELIGHAAGWAQRYHLDPDRANVLRALALPPDARVLEVGAGCGAISRYLGETCAVVDALEPVPARAAAAAARTADLPGVQVFVGEVADVPAEPGYDLIVVIGVLEYVGAGTGDLSPYREFLSELERRLVPGGTLVLAIENRLGVKYLVGAPEDHTGKAFDSIESYPAGGRAHTFSRRALESLMREAGLAPRTLGAFPDYKLTRAVLGEFPDAARSLLYRIPRFPSPDWTRKRPRLADERSVWANLVDAGAEAEFANSLLVLANKADARHQLWPRERSAVFYSENRRTPLSTETVVDRLGDDVVFRRRLIAPDRPPSGPIRVVASTAEFQPGTDLPRVIADVGVAGAGAYLERWLRLLDDALTAGDERALDVVPHNLVLAEDGALHPIDEELVVPGVTREQIVRRGVYLLAKEATSCSAASRWAPCTTVGEVMIAFGALVGLPADGSWLDGHVHDESALQAHIRRGRPASSSDAQWLATIEKGMRTAITKPLADLPLGQRLPARHAALEKTHKQLREQLVERTAELERTKQALASARRTQIPGAVLRLARRLCPPRTRRRDAIRRVRRLAAR